MRVETGDARVVMRGFEAESFDAVVTDPPYGIAFMAEAWDDLGSGRKLQAFHEGWAREAFRVLRPGGWLVAFASPRTYHRLAVAVEDAGFDVRDQIDWSYGQGMPKSVDVGKLLDAKRDDDVRPVARFLRAALERRGVTTREIASAFGVHPRMVDHWAARESDSQPTLPTREQYERLRKLLGFGTEMDDVFARLDARKGTKGEAFARREVTGRRKVRDATKIRLGMPNQPSPSREYADTRAASEEAKRFEGFGTALKPAHEPAVLARKPFPGTLVDNLRRHGTGALFVDGCRVGFEGERKGRHPANVVLDDEAAAFLDERTGVLSSNPMKPTPTTAGRAIYGANARGGFTTIEGYGDEGGASRFFYVAKPTRRERARGADGFPAHPTVKPVALMRHLVRLVVPPGGVLLEPFAGSGTTLVAAVLEGFDAVGIEKDERWAEVSRRRAEFARRHGDPSAPKPEVRSRIARAASNGRTRRKVRIRMKKT